MYCSAQVFFDINWLSITYFLNAPSITKWTNGLNPVLSYGTLQYANKHVYIDKRKDRWDKDWWKFLRILGIRMNYKILIKKRRLN